MTSLFTVIIPVFNREKTIRRAVKSVLSQTYSDFKLVIVDDGSTDNTSSILSGYKDSRMTVIRTENRGVSAARNTAVKKLSTPYAAFLDSDDEWLDYKLENDYQFILANPLCCIFQSQEIWYRYDKRVNPKIRHKKKSGSIFEESLEQCMISPSSVVIHKKVFENIGLFDQNMAVCEDYDLWLRITPFYEIGLIDRQTIIKYGGAEDQLSRSVTAIDRFRIYSMLKLLNNTKYAGYQKKIETVLKRKINIVMDGAEKNGNIVLFENLKRIMSFIEKGCTPRDFSYLLQKEHHL